MMFVLASNSPRRKQLLALGGWTFSVAPTQIDESLRIGEAPREYVMRLAEGKAYAAAQQAAPGEWIVAADTTVADPVGSDKALHPAVLGKPVDAADARQMLLRLRGRTHQVFTALTVLQAGNGVPLTDCCVTDVKMRDYSDPEIEAYVESGDPFDKAGGYAIQHQQFRPVDEVNGCYANVMGLPLCLLRRMFDRLGISAPIQDRLACLYAPQEHCSITPEMI
jgi:nucleoside triphosphate pyrophosphatase